MKEYGCAQIGLRGIVARPHESKADRRNLDAIVGSNDEAPARQAMPLLQYRMKVAALSSTPEACGPTWALLIDEIDRSGTFIFILLGLACLTFLAEHPTDYGSEEQSSEPRNGLNDEA